MVLLTEHGEFHESWQGSLASASPSDVRRGYASPSSPLLVWGYAPGLGSAQDLWAKGQTKGPSPNSMNNSDGEA
jgi:hypothetical protein